MLLREQSGEMTPSISLDDYQLSRMQDRLMCLHRLLTASLPFSEHAALYLQLGSKMFDLESGYIGCVEKGNCRIVSSFGDSRLQIGETLQLNSQPWFKGLHEKRAFGVSNTPGAAIIFSDPAYNRGAPGAYIGAPIVVAGELYGVWVCYSESPKPVPFSEQDIETALMTAEGVAKMVELHRAYQTRTPVTEGFVTEGIKSLEEYRQDASLPIVYGVAGRVVEKLLNRIGSMPMGIERIAEDLSMSKRTLQRRLQQQNLNFAQLRDQVRFHYAIGYLLEQHSSVDNISTLLDFSDRTSFTNAFKRWTGLSPSAFRKLFRDYV